MIKAIDMEHPKITEPLHCLYLIIFYLNSVLLDHVILIILFVKDHCYSAIRNIIDSCHLSIFFMFIYLIYLYSIYIL